MPTIISGCDRRGCSGCRRTTRIAGNSVRRIAGRIALAGGPLSPVLCHAGLALSLLLAACATPVSPGSSPYHAPNDADIGHAGGGSGGGSGM